MATHCYTGLIQVGNIKTSESFSYLPEMRIIARITTNE